MAEFKRIRSFRGDDIYLNVELVQAVTPSRGEDGGQSLVHFGPDHAFLVEGAPEDVMDVLWPAKPIRLRP